LTKSIKTFSDYLPDFFPLTHLYNQRIALEKENPDTGGVPGSPEQRYHLVGTGTAISLYITAPEDLLTLLSNCDFECLRRSKS
jgi:hypothetical protein